MAPVTDEGWDLTEEQAEHVEKLLRRVKAGLMTMEEAALILRAAHPDLRPPPGVFSQGR